MNQRVFVPGEAYETNLARLLRGLHRLHSAAGREDATRVLQPNDFVELHQVNAIRL